MNRLLVSALGLLAALAAAGAASNERLINRIVAVINDDIIFLDELEKATAPLLARLPATLGVSERVQQTAAIRREVLDTLVADRLLDQQVRILKIDVSEREIDSVVDDLRARNGVTQQQLEQILRSQGMTLAEYRAGMHKQLLKLKIINLKVRSKVQVSEQDVQSLYHRQRAAAGQDVQIHVQHILFALAPGASSEEEARQQQRAAQAVQRARAGEDFAGLANELSDDVSAKHGGDMGFFRRGDIVESFENAAFALRPGEISEPVRTPLGWHVIRLVERKTGDVGELSQVEQQLRDQIYQEEVEVAFKRYIDELKQGSHIELRLETPAPRPEQQPRPAPPPKAHP
ncbi:MAG: peptidylprolyl isomerase [Deltaproteobacteria bacterium]|nr:peptidylprolyl isomerase [Deltaproteobacteria bacterium]